eukprot:TRINITY_DN8232_c0_g1_i1.p3 TRINITY_DN8232_c0_g1~~TRINITY_DN8232_c0_g1_i1.p3  ORF type:complete len:186 (-),score=13.02 TRINITY_DN8232_c0_g1_i1:549-1043(-)
MLATYEPEVFPLYFCTAGIRVPDKCCGSGGRMRATKKCVYRCAVQEEKEASLSNAEGTCAKAVDVVTSAGISESQVFWKALRPEGGASEVGKSLVHYCKANKVTVAVVGSHGFSAFTRGMRSFVGLGSVSDYCLHNLSCVVCIIKSDVPTQEPEQPEATADDAS